MYICAEKSGVINGWKGPAWYSDAFNYGIQANYDGTNDPIIVTGSIALAGWLHVSAEWR